jgi:hypothetical protein
MTEILRETLVRLASGESAHASPEKILAGLDAATAAKLPPGDDHCIWGILYHTVWWQDHLLTGMYVFERETDVQTTKCAGYSMFCNELGQGECNEMAVVHWKHRTYKIVLQSNPQAVLGRKGCGKQLWFEPLGLDCQGRDCTNNGLPIEPKIGFNP